MTTEPNRPAFCGQQLDTTTAMGLGAAWWGESYQWWLSNRDRPDYQVLRGYIRAKALEALRLVTAAAKTSSGNVAGARLYAIRNILGRARGARYSLKLRIRKDLIAYGSDFYWTLEKFQLHRAEAMELACGESIERDAQRVTSAESRPVPVPAPILEAA